MEVLHDTDLVVLTSDAECDGVGGIPREFQRVVTHEGMVYHCPKL